MKPYFFVITLIIIFCLLQSAGSETVWENIQLNADSTLELQNEEQIALNPTNPDNMVCVWRDFRLGYRQVGWGYTFDGGATWTDGGLFTEPNYDFQSDPGVTADIGGNFYAIVLSSNTTWVNGLYVFKSTDGGMSWGAPLEVISGFPNAFEDKEFIACDRTNSTYSGNLYVVWNRFINEPFSTQIVLRRSADAGQTWSETVPVSDDFGVHYPIPVVGREGELYVAWTDYNNAGIKIDVSLDGGVTFGADRDVTDVLTPEHAINGGILTYSSPHMDADITGGQYSGRLYVSFMDQRNGLIDFDIWVTMSDDRGLTWSAPIRINDDAPDNGCDQFHPWLTVDNTGIVTVAFLDRRDDPGNLYYNCYLTQSLDGGTTWSANVRVSAESSNPELASRSLAFAQEHEPWDLEIGDAGAPQRSVLAGLLGEYIGVAAYDSVPTPVWTDIRNGNQDVFAGHIKDDAAVLIQRFEASRVESAIRLSWDIITDESIAGFNMYRKNGQRGREELINKYGLIPESDRSYDDVEYEAGQIYYYILCVVRQDGSEVRSHMVELTTVPYRFTLAQNYPNPFNPATTILYSIPEPARVSLQIYDANGHLIKTLVNKKLNAGPHESVWLGMDKNGKPVASGIYFIRLKVRGNVQIRKMILLK